MASRDTREEAEELKTQFEEWFPGHKIVIRERANAYDVLEERICETCGSEFTTMAVGEYNPSRCHDCEESAGARRASVGRNAEREGREQVARHMAFDEYSS